MERCGGCKQWDAAGIERLELHKPAVYSGGWGVCRKCGPSGKFLGAPPAGLFEAIDPSEGIAGVLVTHKDFGCMEWEGRVYTPKDPA